MTDDMTNLRLAVEKSVVRLASRNDYRYRNGEIGITADHLGRFESHAGHGVVNAAARVVYEAAKNSRLLWKRVSGTPTIRKAGGTALDLQGRTRSTRWRLSIGKAHGATSEP